MSNDVSSQVARELFLRGFLGATSFVGDTAARIARRVDDLWLPAGKTLYVAGEPADEHFFLVEGEVEITDAEGHSRRLGGRSMVGILDVAQERPRTRTATATLDTHLLRLRANDWFDALEEDFDFARGAVHNIARGLMQMHLTIEGRGFESHTSALRERARSGSLSFVDRTLLLRAVPPFRLASVQAAVDLVPHARVRELDDGAVLVEPGAPKSSIFIVANGAIALEQGERSLAKFAHATLVGGLGCLSPDPWPAILRASGCGGRVLELDYEDVFDAMEEHFDLVKSCISGLSRERESLQGFEAERRLPPAG